MDTRVTMLRNPNTVKNIIGRRDVYFSRVCMAT